MAVPKTLEVPGYQVMQFLGNGARSTIWQIRDRETNELYTLKRVVRRDPSDSRFLEQAANEYHIASQLNHPALRRAIRMRRVKKWLSLREIHLVMEYCPGQTLQEERPQDVCQTVNFFITVGQALEYMNAQQDANESKEVNYVRCYATAGAISNLDHTTAELDVNYGC